VSTATLSQVILFSLTSAFSCYTSRKEGRVGVSHIALEGKTCRYGASNDHENMDDGAVGQVGSTFGGPKRESIPRRILVVDDNETARISLAILLEVMGHTVTTASSGVKAIQCVKDFQPEVVFLDLMMPGMSGYETARCIREQPTVLPMTLIAVTGWGPADRDFRSCKSI
jgi:Response regulator receiver domain